MPEKRPPRPDSRYQASRLFETRSHSWAEVGLIRQLSKRAVKRARLQALVLVPLFIGVVVVYDNRTSIFHYSTKHRPSLDGWVSTGAVLALMIIGWAVARNIGKAFGPWLFRRMDPATAGTVGFLIRVATVVVVLIIALNVAGLHSGTLAIGGSITAVVLGLAAQQTLGNFFAGTVLLSARPFRVGERVRLQGGSIGGQIEGIVSSLGLLYTSIAVGEESVLVPNSVVLNVAVMPLREPSAINLRARVSADTAPADLQSLLEQELETPLRTPPQITLEELDGDDVIVRIQATPQVAADGPQLASELLAAVAARAREGGVSEDDGQPNGDRPTR
jgi:small-conductance mechanosensitive channel